MEESPGLLPGVEFPRPGQLLSASSLISLCLQNITVTCLFRVQICGSRPEQEVLLAGRRVAFEGRSAVPQRGGVGWGMSSAPRSSPSPFAS